MGNTKSKYPGSRNNSVGATRGSILVAMMLVVSGCSSDLIVRGDFTDTLYGTDISGPLPGPPSGDKLFVVGSWPLCEMDFIPSDGGPAKVSFAEFIPPELIGPATKGVHIESQCSLDFIPRDHDYLYKGSQTSHTYEISWVGRGNGTVTLHWAGGSSSSLTVAQDLLIVDDSDEVISFFPGAGSHYIRLEVRRNQGQLNGIVQGVQDGVPGPAREFFMVSPPNSANLLSISVDTRSADGSYEIARLYAYQRRP